MDCSYFLLWSYQGFDNAKNNDGANGNTKNVRFKGPNTDADRDKLIVQDGLFWSESDLLNSWRSTHRFDGAQKATVVDSMNVSGPDIYYSVLDPSETMPDIDVNAGYVDGRVERCNSLDFNRVLLPSVSYISLYITEDYR